MISQEEYNLLSAQKRRLEEENEISEKRLQEAEEANSNLSQKYNDVEKKHRILMRKIENLNRDKMMTIQMEANGLLHTELMGPWTFGDWRSCQKQIFQDIRQNQISLEAKLPVAKVDVDLSDAVIEEPVDPLIEAEKEKVRKKKGIFNNVRTRIQ